MSDNGRSEVVRDDPAKLQTAKMQKRAGSADDRWLRRIYRDAPVGLCCFDIHLRYVDINEWLANLNGLSVEEHLGHFLSELFPELASGIESQLRHVIETGESIQEGSVFAETPSMPGVKRHFQHNYKAVKSDEGTIVGVSCAVIENTAQKELEEQIQQQRKNLAHMTRLNTMGEMASGLAHELNQPLMGISLYAETCLSRLKSLPRQDAELRETIEKIRDQSVRAGDIIHRLRRFVKKGGPRTETIQVSNVINDVLKFLDSELKNEGVSLEVNLPDDLPEVRGDTIQLQQVLLNLILNATEAMKEDESDRREIVLEAARTAEGFVKIGVRDTGPGIGEELMSQIFNAFFSTKSTGLGMGLAICRTIVESHGGKISVSRNSDCGVTFEMLIPADPREGGLAG